MTLSQKELGIYTITVTGHDLLKCCMGQAISCKEYPILPREAEEIINEVTNVCMERFEKVGNAGFYIRRFDDYDDLYGWLRRFILPIPVIQRLNLSQAEINAGIIDVDDNRRSETTFVGRGIPATSKDKDFIDLDAYIRNVAHDLIRENIDIDFSSFKSKEVE